ncbi:MAG: nucleotidyltransferase domain-containing protein [Ignavibacteriales bacterium]|nr:nucleotidyltransferase domain-containing protein [Ignavibacteriales bacterium]
MKNDKNMDILQIVKELHSRLENRFPGLVADVILYGSHARGEAHKNSDVDVLLILNSAFDWHLQNDIYDECNEINVTYNVLIDVNILSKQDEATIRWHQPYVENALREGISVLHG